MESSRKKQFALMGLLMLVGAFAYSGSINAPFYLDDYGNVINRESVQLSEISWEGVQRVLFDSPLLTRPTANLSFALNYYFSGYSVVGFHVVNIAIHLLAGIFLLQFLVLTFRTPALQGRFADPIWTAFAAAVIWTVHPVQTQAVTYIVQRMTSMAAMFYILSLFCYVSGRLSLPSSKVRGIWWFAASLLAMVLALGSKEIAVTLPVFILLYEWFFFQDCSRKFLNRVLPLVIAGTLLAGLALYAYDNDFLSDRLLRGYASRDFTLGERLLTEPRVILYYVSLLVLPLPSRLSLEYDFPLSASLFSPPSTLIAIVLIVAGVVLAVIYAKQYRLYSFIVFWFLGNLLLESSVIPLELIFEHRLYLPSMPVFVVVPVLAETLVRKKMVRHCLLALLVLVLGIWTLQRNAVWADPLAFHRHNIERAGNNYRSHYNLGHYYLGTAQFPEAIKHLSHALELEPEYVLGHEDLGFSYFMTGEYTKALQHYLVVKEAYPDLPKISYYLGLIYQKLGKEENAIAAFSEVVGMDPDHERAHSYLGNLYVGRREFRKAIMHYLQVLRLSGENNFGVLVNLGNCYARLESYEKAIRYFTMALRLQPGHAGVTHNLNLARQRLGEKE